MITGVFLPFIDPSVIHYMDETCYIVDISWIEASA